MSTPAPTRRALPRSGLLALLAVAGCGHRAPVQSTLPLRRVVVYRNGVGYFERHGRVGDSVSFRVRQSEVDDFLSTLAVMESGGSSVRSAAFPLPEERASDAPPPPDARRTVRVELEGREHDLVVGYTAETPIWRPSYRLVFSGNTAQMQAWGIVQNLSGEDWSGVRLSLVAGSPVSFHSELSRAIVPPRPTATDEGTVITAVPRADTTLARGPDIPVVLDASGGAPAEHQFDISLSEGSNGVDAPGDRAGRAPSVAGRLSPDAVRAVVLRNQAQVARCHQQSLATHPGASGRVVVRFIIGGDGGVRGSSVAESTYPVPEGAQCVADAVRGWRFPAPDDVGLVTVSYSFNLGGAADTGVSDEPSAAPRDRRSIATLSLQSGVTRYDLPGAVTVPDRTATMVMLAAREVPGYQMYLYAPDPGVADSSTHPFRVARFENRSGGMLERGALAVYESGAFLGQGLMEPLPDGATATVPFALDRSLAVEHSSTTSVEGARLVRMRRNELTVERFDVERTTYRARSGLDRPTRLLVRHPLDGAQLFEPPYGVEQSGADALVPMELTARGRAELVVAARRAVAATIDLNDDLAVEAIEQYLHDGHPAPNVALALLTAIEMRRQIDVLARERADLERRRADVAAIVSETRESLTVLQRNLQSAVLRASLVARLSRGLSQLYMYDRRLGDIDTLLGERRVRMTEAARVVDVDTARPAAPAPPAPPAAPAP